MIVNCSELIGVGRGIAGFGALCYISYRVWGHIARSEPIDFYPLLRPFAIGLAITLFPAVISADQWHDATHRGWYRCPGHGFQSSGGEPAGSEAGRLATVCRLADVCRVEW